MHDICHDWAVYISYHLKGLLLLTINLLMFLFIPLLRPSEENFVIFLSAPDISQGNQIQPSCRKPIEKSLFI